MAVMPLSALLFSYSLLHEAFRTIHLRGIALVLSSVALMSWVHAEAMAASEEEEDAPETTRARDARLPSACQRPGMVPAENGSAGQTSLKKNSIWYLHTMIYEKIAFLLDLNSDDVVDPPKAQAITKARANP